MQLNSKKLERTSRLIYNAISLVLCLFLILLSNAVLDDLDEAIVSPDAAAFEGAASMTRLMDEKEGYLRTQEGQDIQIGDLERIIKAAQQNYADEKSSFDNWLETRKTLGSPEQDREVLARAGQLDAIRKIEQQWRGRVDSIQTLKRQTAERIRLVETRLDKERDLTQQDFQKALSWYELKVFLLRLMFIGPVLALGVFFFIRKRRHKFWPLFMGFSLFSLYAFFVGLAPYLPSYGGYVRYIVGVLLSAGLGYYAIRVVAAYLAAKKLELQASAQDRAGKVQTEAAEKALEHHLCPSCGKDFTLKKWEMGASDNVFATFCRYCGLELFRACRRCGAKNYAHLPYCATCGEAAGE